MNSIDNATRVEDLAAPLKYPSLEVERNRASRELEFNDSLARTIELKTEEFQKNGGGRFRPSQMIYLMYKSLEGRTAGDSFYRLADLMVVKLHGDKHKGTLKQLEELLLSWDYILAGMDVIPNWEVKVVLFYGQARDLDVLDFDMKHYVRDLEPKEEAFEEKFDYLYKSCQRLIDRQRMVDNQRDLHRSYRGLTKQLTPAMAVIDGELLTPDENFCWDDYDVDGFEQVSSAPGTYRQKFKNQFVRKKSPRTRGRSTSPSGRKKTGRSNSPGAPGTTRGRGSTPTKNFLLEEPWGGTNICFDFQKGKCSPGSRCKYSHNPEILKYRKPSMPPNTANNFPCTSYQLGNCKLGDKCKYKRVKVIGGKAAPAEQAAPAEHVTEMCANSPAAIGPDV